MEELEKELLELKEYKKESERKIKELEEKIEKIKTIKKIRRAEEGKAYYFIDTYGVDGEYENNNVVDDANYEKGNYFLTIEEAKKALEKVKIYTKLNRFAEENNVDRIDWEKDHVHKWCICYDYNLNEIVVRNALDLRGIGEIYFTNEEIAEQAIEEIGEENIKKLFE